MFVFTNSAGDDVIYIIHIEGEGCLAERILITEQAGTPKRCKQNWRNRVL